jgi:glutathione reductase (NADPH)
LYETCRAFLVSVVFSHPPIGTVGLTEQQAKAEFGAEKIKTKQAHFTSLEFAMNGSEGHGDGTQKASYALISSFTSNRPQHSCNLDEQVKTAFKLVLFGPEERVVGLHCLGPASDELLQGFAVALKMGATRHDFEAAVAIHPTTAEELVTFGGWGQVIDPSTGKAKPRLEPSIFKETEAATLLNPSLPSVGALLIAAALGGLAVALVAKLQRK